MDTTNPKQDDENDEAEMLFEKAQTQQWFNLKPQLNLQNTKSKSYI